jgi:hypothetical protein
MGVEDRLPTRPRPSDLAPVPLTLTFLRKEGTLSGGQLEVYVESAETRGTPEITGAQVPEG